MDNVLNLRPLRGGDEREVREAHRIMESEDFAFAPVWHRFDVVDRARAEFGVPVTHVVATPVEAAQAAP